MKKFLAVILCVGFMLGFVVSPGYAVEDVSAVTNWNSLTASAASSSGGDKIMLSSDISGTTQLTIGHDLTLDLNGKTLAITVSAENGVKLENDVTFTISDSSGNGSLKVYNRLSESSSGNGAAINSGNGTLIINSGTVIAEGGCGGAGIGSGYAADFASIIINGGTVTATGGSGPDEGAGIGNGAYGSPCGTIAINGGTVTAIGGSGYYRAGVGIGGGVIGTGGGGGPGGGGKPSEPISPITSNSTVSATSSGTIGNIVITNGTITATGGFRSGNYYYSLGGQGRNLEIRGGSVTTLGAVEADTTIAGNVELQNSYFTNGMTVNGGFTLTVTGMLDLGRNTLNSGTIINAGTIIIHRFFENAGTITNNGEIRYDNSFVNTGTINNRNGVISSGGGTWFKNLPVGGTFSPSTGTMICGVVIDGNNITKLDLAAEETESGTLIVAFYNHGKFLNMVTGSASDYMSKAENDIFDKILIPENATEFKIMLFDSFNTMLPSCNAGFVTNDGTWKSENISVGLIND